MKIVIKDGILTGFEDEIKKINNTNLKIDVFSTKRVSHIYPTNFILKIFFIFFRKIFGDNGKIANWTRNWKCYWTVYIPEKGYFGKFKDRRKAIEFEKKLIWQLKKSKGKI